jgi:hypothetical protein
MRLLIEPDFKCWMALQSQKGVVLRDVDDVRTKRSKVSRVATSVYTFFKLSSDCNVPVSYPNQNCEETRSLSHL